MMRLVLAAVLIGLQAKELKSLAQSGYSNPIVYADYSDPDIVAAHDGNGYYLTASSFQCVPGLPILHSIDLVDWEIVNYALDAVPPVDYYGAAPRHGKGVWAPSIRYHDGLYYIYWGDPDFGIFMVKTSNPKERWSEPILVKAGKGMIDPCPLWDDDGRAYLIHAWAGSRSKFNSVLTMWQMSADGTSLMGQPRIVFDGNDGINHTCEGPKLYKRNGLYYILCPAGGVANGWQLALRSPQIWGPYESKVVMRQGSTNINGPHQGGMADAHDGSSWFVNFQELQPWGRILHLNPINWVDGWPIMGNNGEPVSEFTAPIACKIDEQFKPNVDTNSSIGLQWQWQANYQPCFGMPTAYGNMRIYSHLLDTDNKNLWNVPNMLLQKLSGPKMRVTSKVKVTACDDNQQSGMIVMGRNYCRIALQKSGDKFVIKLIDCIDADTGNAERVIAERTLENTNVYNAGSYNNYECDIFLMVDITNDGLCEFAYSTDGNSYEAIGDHFTAREGKWIGAKVGFYSVSHNDGARGWIDIGNLEVR